MQFLRENLVGIIIHVALKKRKVIPNTEKYIKEHIVHKWHIKIIYDNNNPQWKIEYVTNIHHTSHVNECQPNR